MCLNTQLYVISKCWSPGRKKGHATLARYKPSKCHLKHEHDACTWCSTLPWAIARPKQHGDAVVMSKFEDDKQHFAISKTRIWKIQHPYSLPWFLAVHMHATQYQIFTQHVLAINQTCSLFIEVPSSMTRRFRSPYSFRMSVHLHCKVPQWRLGALRGKESM